MNIDKLSIAVEIDVTAYSDIMDVIDAIAALSVSGNTDGFTERLGAIRERLKQKIADVENRASE